MEPWLEQATPAKDPIVGQVQPSQTASLHLSENTSWEDGWAEIYHLLLHDEMATTKVLMVVKAKFHISKNWRKDSTRWSKHAEKTPLTVQQRWNADHFLALDAVVEEPWTPCGDHLTEEN